MPSKLLTVIEYPTPSLAEPSTPVALDELDTLQEFIDDMIYTMYYQEGVGLAAPQVGRNLRLFIIDQRPINGNRLVEPWVFINPELEVLTDNRVERPEGCLSFPGLIAEVGRPEWVKVVAFDRKGEKFTMDTTYNHLFSVAIQHEYDHLEGTLLSDRAKGKDRRTIKRWASQKR